MTIFHQGVLMGEKLVLRTHLEVQSSDTSEVENRELGRSFQSLIVCQHVHQNLNITLLLGFMTFMSDNQFVLLQM